jgi:hypothetical protein
MTDAAADAQFAAGTTQESRRNRVALVHRRCTRPAMPAMVCRCTSGSKSHGSAVSASKIKMLEDHRRQQRCRASAVELPHDRRQRGATDPEATTLVAEQISPTTRARSASSGVAAIGNGSRARNDHHARCITGTGDKGDKGVVDNDHLCLETDPAHDALYGGGVVRSIDPRDAQTDGRRSQVTLADRRVHDLMEDLLDLEFTRGLQVGTSATRLADDAPVTISEQTHRFCASRIYAEDVHL